MFIVRHARQSEIRLLAAIGLRAWEQAIAALADAAKMRRLAEQAFDTFLARHWHTVQLVEEGGRVRGWVAREDLDGTISDLWIEPETQGRGLGSFLLAHIEKRIVADGFDTASARTHAQNASAIAFFQRSGYRVNWLSTAYSQKLDRDVQFIGLSKPLISDSIDAFPQNKFQEV
ncbi:GNAT family N-acetyltransferase [Sinorhizobium sp. 8-89]|uniref:GNAT family N-acetyltransferase n=1 Tax=Sinorhizobium sp. 7-81 TaxID=3049087 RepID=UPI0024C28453|nr:GNAT family N-acetyltransferase [Sinorhizobium sp. 7-81]MDK1385090.1 GNAT family N-acetyltransferase [Sinorhizobium sp. 7-81]